MRSCCCCSWSFCCRLCPFFIIIVVVVHVFDVVIVAVDPRNLPLKVCPNWVINRTDHVVVVIVIIVVVVDFVVLLFHFFLSCHDYLNWNFPGLSACQRYFNNGTLFMLRFYNTRNVVTYQQAWIVFFFLN